MHDIPETFTGPDSTNSTGDPYSAGAAYWSLIGRRQHTLPNNPEVCEIALGMAELRFSKFILPSIALMHLFLFKMYFLLETLCLTTTTTR
jgi:hypothetical protein